ncbi:MAG: hypothetical protein LBF38_08995 [Deltaproteobacteria bacterium]|jgi:cell division protein FtsB|nr:hypothetical protein [Deltaproteobacteria bacterium]
MNIDDNDKSNLTDDIKFDLDTKLSEDFSLDAPDLEPAPASETILQKSQAVKDLEELEKTANLDDQKDKALEAKSDSSSAAKKEAAKKKAKNPSPNPSGPRGYRWFLVHLLSLLGLLAWTITSFLSALPYRWEAALITLAVILLTVPTMKTFHVRTRAGLAGLGAALGLAVSSLYDPNIFLLPGLPLAFVWLIILTVTWIWLIAAIIRNQDLRKNKVSLVLSALLLYPLLAPIFAIVDGLVVSGMPVSEFSLNYLNQSPVFLTQYLPWFFWPQAFMAFLIPPLAAIFLLKDQLGYKKTDPEKYHLGALWLSLAGFVVLIYSVFSIQPISEDYPGLVNSVRGLWPAAKEYHESQVAKTATLTAAAKPKPKPKPAESQAATPAVAPDAAPAEAPTQSQAAAQTDSPTEAASPAEAQTEAPAESSVASDSPAPAEPTQAVAAPAESSDSTIVASAPKPTEPAAPSDQAQAAAPTPSPEPATETAPNEPVEAADASTLTETATSPQAPVPEAVEGTQAPVSTGPEVPADAALADKAQTSAPAAQSQAGDGEANVASASDGGTGIASAAQSAATSSEAQGSDPAVRESQASDFPEVTAGGFPPQGQESETLSGYDEGDKLGSIIPRSLEVGSTESRFAPGNDGDSTAILVLSPDSNELDVEALNSQIEGLSFENQELANLNQAQAEEINNLRTQILVLQTQNQILQDRLNYNDQIIINLTTPR